MTGERNSARSLARDALMRIEETNAYANLLVPAMLDRSRLEARDRRFVTELVYGVTRMRRAVDAALEPYVKRELEPAVRAALRLGAYQLLHAGVAPHAAVSATVDIAPKRAQGLVNAVLRRVADAGPPELHDPAVRLSYPDWIVQLLRADLGDTEAFGALEAMNAPPRPHTREDGYVQDPASGWVAGLVDAQLGHRVADVCAAPGGKATAMAHVVCDPGVVVAADVHPGRVALMAQNVVTTDTVGVVAPVVADGLRPPLRTAAFDRVLVDAPCSGLGVLHRRPDARWRVSETDVGDMAAQGKRLLAAAAPLVTVGGVLVYSVCTITSAETADVAGWAVRSLPGFTPMRAPGGPWRPHGHGALLLPQAAGTDGMFILRLRRS